MHSFSYKQGCMTGSAYGLLSGCSLFEPRRLLSLTDMVSAIDHSFAAACVPVVPPCPHPFVFVIGLNKSSRQSWRVTVSSHFQHTYSNIVPFVAVILQLSFHVLAKVYPRMKWNGQKWQTEIVYINFSVGDSSFSRLGMWGRGLVWSGLG
jgi:hypothetical protein